MALARSSPSCSMPSPSQTPRLPPVLERKVGRLKGTNVVVLTCNGDYVHYWVIMKGGFAWLYLHLVHEVHCKLI